VAPESRVVGAGELVDHPKKIALHYIKTYFFIDLFVVLPLPQVNLSPSLSGYFHSHIIASNMIFLCSSIQYTLQSNGNCLFSFLVTNFGCIPFYQDGSKFV